MVAGKVKMAMGLQKSPSNHNNNNKTKPEKPPPPSKPPSPSPTSGGKQQKTSVLNRSFGAYFPRASAQVQPQPRPPAPEVTDLLRLVEELRERESRLRTELVGQKLLRQSAAIVPLLEAEIVAKDDEIQRLRKKVLEVEMENEKLVNEREVMKERFEKEMEELKSLNLSSRFNLGRNLSFRKKNLSSEGLGMVKKEEEVQIEAVSSTHSRGNSSSSEEDVVVVVPEGSDAIVVKSKGPRVPKPPPTKRSPPPSDCSSSCSSSSSSDGRRSLDSVCAPPPPPPPLPPSSFPGGRKSTDIAPPPPPPPSSSSDGRKSTVIAPPPPPPPPPSCSFSDDRKSSGIAPPPPPPPPAPAMSKCTGPPPPPPPPPAMKKSSAAPPPPPPPPSKGLRSATASVKRVPEVVEFYHSLMRRDSRREPGAGAAEVTAEVTAASARDLVGEIENRSAYLLAIKTDVETQGEFIRFLIKEVETAAFTDIEDVVSFVKWLDDELSYLVDERAVLKHFDWPEQKADALREAAFEYSDLKKLESEASSFRDDARQPCGSVLKKMQTLLEKLEHGVYNISRLRESASNRFKSFHIPVDWMLDTGFVSQIKLASVKLAMKYMKRVSAELEAVGGGPEEEELIVQGVRFAFRVHQFAGGFDVETMRAFEELRDKARSCHSQCQSQRHQKLMCRSMHC